MPSIDELIAAYLATEQHASEPEKQKISWKRASWSEVWASGDVPGAEVLDKIDEEVSTHGTIRRAWLRGLPDRDPIIFLAASTIWGYGNYVRFGRNALRSMLTSSDVAASVANIIEASRQDAGLGFSALFDRGSTRVKWLGIAFGTKVVHFAGYDHANPPPLVLDRRVFATASLVCV